MIGVVIGLVVAVVLFLVIRRVVGGKRVRNVGITTVVSAAPMPGRFEKRGGGRL